MAFLSIHTMEGDPADLLARKRQHMDPVTGRLAHAFGALVSVTSRTKTGIVTVNVWETPEGAAAFSQEPEVVQARQASGLPRPVTLERFTDADFVCYGKG
jgi:hypothetical protein